MNPGLQRFDTVLNRLATNAAMDLHPAIVAKGSADFRTLLGELARGRHQQRLRLLNAKLDGL
eukprot:CAMPEP_0176031566 /NCGR_PEP_ID=MMETSP0120_2-20121206/15563_1 /TAXON_ID=160619 /ORGANISM="Kryptoperidinium foliaceum, Strain CCMP 1326" /LENGTH=61 /DNA_ID=CAMNT_0017364859 /DNA_START=330 /DNA_END=515 /DNA_ORIENTATION=-